VLVRATLVNHLLRGLYPVPVVGSDQAQEHLGALLFVEHRHYLAIGQEPVFRSMNHEHRRLSVEDVVPARIWLGIAREGGGGLDARIPTAGVKEPERGDGAFGVSGDTDVIRRDHAAQGARACCGGQEHDADHEAHVARLAVHVGSIDPSGSTEAGQGELRCGYDEPRRSPCAEQRFVVARHGAEPWEKTISGYGPPPGSGGAFDAGAADARIAAGYQMEVVSARLGRAGLPSWAGVERV
jgi:hypothetical protein